MNGQDSSKAGYVPPTGWIIVFYVGLVVVWCAACWWGLGR